MREENLEREDGTFQRILFLSVPSSSLSLSLYFSFFQCFSLFPTFPFINKFVDQRSFSSRSMCLSKLFFPLFPSFFLSLSLPLSFSLALHFVIFSSFHEFSHVFSFHASIHHQHPFASSLILIISLSLSLSPSFIIFLLHLHSI